MPISKIDQVDSVGVGSLLAQVAGGSNQAIAQALNLATQRGMQAERLFADQQTQFIKERDDVRNFEEGQRQFGLNFGENQRQFGLNFGENQRQFNTQQNLREREFGERQEQFDAQQSLREREFGERQEQFDTQQGLRERELNLSQSRFDLSDEQFRFRVSERDRRLSESTGAESTGATRTASESEEFQNAASVDNSSRIAELEQAKEVADEQGKREINSELVKLRSEQTADSTQSAATTPTTPPAQALTPPTFEPPRSDNPPPEIQAFQRFTTSVDPPEGLDSTAPLTFEPTTPLEREFAESGLRPDVFQSVSLLRRKEQDEVFSTLSDIVGDNVDQITKGVKELSEVSNMRVAGNAGFSRDATDKEKASKTKRIEDKRFGRKSTRRSETRVEQLATRMADELSDLPNGPAKERLIQEFTFFIQHRTQQKLLEQQRAFDRSIENRQQRTLQEPQQRLLNRNTEGRQQRILI